MAKKAGRGTTKNIFRLLTCEWHVVSLRGMTLIRAYPKCKSEHFIKNGKLHARQRYECKACGYNFTVSKLGKSKPPEVIDLALEARTRNEKPVILFNLCGHGLLDLYAYDDYLQGRLAD